ncbi:MAG: [FeFe] hydrogenase, group A [Lachnospiraceae bacterium]|jgi:NADP-reducing hydrogenase subunit HndD|nr:[FeFe] hydrogenase, group A [Lachnospiraceae bacterium]
MSEKKIITLTIDGQSVSVPMSSTILEAARHANIEIPTLCFLKDINQVGDCRMCIVQVEGMRGFVTSCIQVAQEGMNVSTNTKEVVEARKVVLDLILSNHQRDCLTCNRNQNCELQTLAQKFNVTNVEYEGARNKYEIDDMSPSIVRDFNKCILCRRCVATCKKVQQVSAIDSIGRGFTSSVGTAGNNSLDKVNCVFCGQCINNCPVGALKEKDSTREVFRKLKDKKQTILVQTAPAVRVALGEEFGMPVGTNVQGKMVTALKKLGFDKVFDTNTAADLTIMEEATEFVNRFKNGGTLPMITSCSPGWVRYIEMNYPELLPHLSTCKSPHEMFGAILKSYYAEKQKISPEDLYVVSVMPCVAKKFEAKREELKNDELENVDSVLTTRELARMIKQEGIDFVNLEDTDFDSPMQEATGAAAIFGTTGGVMEAALRTAYEWVTGKELGKLDFEDVRGKEGIKHASVKLGDITLKVAVAHGLSNAKKILEEIKAGKADYQFVEIMACPGGCIMGGGQPIKSSKERMEKDVRDLRAKAIYNIDKESKIRKSHENPDIQKLYKEYLEAPGGHKAHELLHTHYVKREKYKD